MDDLGVPLFEETLMYCLFSKKKEGWSSSPIQNELENRPFRRIPSDAWPIRRSMAQGALCSFSFGTGPREDQGDGRMAHRWE